MTLLEQAKKESERRMPCIWARALKNATPEMQAEVRELIDDPDISQKIKARTINEALGSDIDDTTIGRKMKDGCRCAWCIDNGWFQV